MELDFPAMKRRWNVTIFRNEAVDGGIKNTVAAEHQNVRSIWGTGEIVGYGGELCFVDESGKKVVASAVPFIATEVTPTSVLDEIEAERARSFKSLAASR